MNEGKAILMEIRPSRNLVLRPPWYIELQPLRAASFQRGEVIRPPAFMWESGIGHRLVCDFALMFLCVI